MLNGVDFQTLVEFAITKENITTSIAIEYTYDCTQLQGSMKIEYMSIWTYLTVFLLLVVYNSVVYFKVEEPDPSLV